MIASNEMKRIFNKIANLGESSLIVSIALSNFLTGFAVAQQERTSVNEDVAKMVAAREMASELNKKFGLRGSSTGASIEALNRSGYICGLERSEIGPDEGVPQVICEKKDVDHKDCPVHDITLHFDAGDSTGVQDDLFAKMLSSVVTRFSGFCPHVESSKNGTSKFLSVETQSMSAFAKKMNLIGKSPSGAIKEIIQLGGMCGYADPASSNVLSFSCTIPPSRFKGCLNPHLNFSAAILPGRKRSTLFGFENARIVSASGVCG
jgi:hypothetical protein